ncbi:MAG: Cationic amino acid transporter 2 [Lichina confinis]|nr:MAG: Cationic amino acid transporter 2 [Lichina confinis]
MRSLAEMVSVRPVSGALIDYPHTFVDPALGFAVGVSYFLSQCMSMATLTSSAARIAGQFSSRPNSSPDVERNQKIGIVIGLCVLTLFSNLCGIRLYGRFERMIKWFKFVLIIGLCVLMIVIKAGVGRRSSEPETQGYANGKHSITRCLRWYGFTSKDDNLSCGRFTTDISGDGGRFLSIWTSLTLAMFSCWGADSVLVTAGEAASPRRDLPQAARFMYLVPVGLYILMTFLLGFNINFLDPGLLRPWIELTQPTAATTSPFIIVVKRAGIETLPSVLNACFLVSAYTTANTALYTSSRTLFSMAQMYGKNTIIARTLGRTNNGHTPVAAILFCSVFGLLSMLGIADRSFDQPILSLTAFFTGSMGCIYASQCLAFLRFKSGLTQLKKNHSLSRGSDLYKDKHYRAHWQPGCAIFGLVACVLIVIFSGWPAIYLLVAGEDSENAVRKLEPGRKLKPSRYFVADIVGAYSGPILFVLLYATYKLLYRTRLRTFREYEDMYFLPEFDKEPLHQDGPLKPRWRYVLRVTWSLVR